MVDNGVIKIQCGCGQISSGGTETDGVGVDEVVGRWAHICWCRRCHMYVPRRKFGVVKDAPNSHIVSVGGRIGWVRW